MEPHLRAQVSEMMHQYTWLFNAETIDLAFDDIAQEVRVRFWQATAVRKIKYPKAYLSRMVHNIVVDLARTYEATLPLPLDAHGELYQGHMIIVASESWQDPLQQFLQEESEQTNIQLLVNFILQLPRRQREAMVCLLKPLMEDVYVFEQILKKTLEEQNLKVLEEYNLKVKALKEKREILKANNKVIERQDLKMLEEQDLKVIEEYNKVLKERTMDIEKVDWPQNARQNRRLRSSLMIARKKLAKNLGESVGDLEEEISSLSGIRAYARREQALQAEQQRKQKLQMHLKKQEERKKEIREKKERERKRQLTKMFMNRGAHLPERYRVVLQLHYMERCSFSEIARRLAMPKGTVKAHIHRGIQLLRQEAQMSPETRSNIASNDLESLGIMLDERCSELAEPYQTTVRLRYREHHTYPEIAQMLGVSTNTVKSRVSRARKLLLGTDGQK